MLLQGDSVNGGRSMHTRLLLARSRSLTIGITFILVLLFMQTGTTFAHSRGSGRSYGGFYQEINLVSDIPGVAAVTDAHLVNPWGISLSSTSPFWVADNGTSVSTLYDGQGHPIPLIVTIPPPAGGTVALPTGTVYNTFNSSGAFPISANGVSGPSLFLFDTITGTISGWNPTVAASQAIVVVDNSKAGAVYTGLAIGSNSAGPLLFAANFSAGTIDVFNQHFAPATLHGSFHDPDIPKGYAPFNIQSIDSQLYVMYARQDRVAGNGNGFVDIFDTDGNLVKRLITQGELNLPWGVALAPANFGQFSNALLVGNFGNGWINAFDPVTGNFLGSLGDQNGYPFVFDKLWALTFGNGGKGGQPNQLFFTAGIQNEQHGLFGVINAM
jgi:uncharacterized protein (TIGR03118 family)